MVLMTIEKQQDLMVKQVLVLGIVKIANTNTVNIIEKVREKIENEITPNLPPGLKNSVFNR